MHLTPRWTTLRPHPVQKAYWTSPHRFNTVPAGRRSGKTELAKRKLVTRALRGTAFDSARFFAAAPTREQAKRIYWDDLKRMIPERFKAGRPSETELVIRLVTGTELYVLGLDTPARIEGQPWDGGVVDEIGNCKPMAWPMNIRPALADRAGWCDLIGVPEGKNHYYELDAAAKAQMAEHGARSEWGSFNWYSEDILSPAEIAAAKQDLPALVYRQEYQAEFLDWSGVEFFALESFLVDGAPIAPPARCDGVFAIIDTATKTGKKRDGTGVIYFAYTDIGPGYPLVVLDWDIQQIEGALLESWLPTVFQNLEALADQHRARMGSLGAFIEDKASGMVLIQQAARHGWPAQAIDSALTALGKDERAISVSGYVYRGMIKVTQRAFEKVVRYKDKTRNHMLGQLQDFRIGDPDQMREDDLVDCLCYGAALALGDSRGW